MATMQVLVTLVLGIDGHGGIAQHGFDGWWPAPASRRFPSRDTADARKGCPARLTPPRRRRWRSGKTGTSSPGGCPGTSGPFIQPAEGFPHRLETLVHGEAFRLQSRLTPMRGPLVHNASAVLVLPLPGPLQEGFPADAVLGQAFLAMAPQSLLPWRWPRGPCPATRSGRPSCDGSEWPHPAGCSHGVTHVQLAGDVGRRHHNGKGFLPGTRCAVKPARLPRLINVVLNGLRIEFCFISAPFFCVSMHNSPSSDDVHA